MAKDTDIDRGEYSIKILTICIEQQVQKDLLKVVMGQHLELGKTALIDIIKAL